MDADVEDRVALAPDADKAAPHRCHSRCERRCAPRSACRSRRCRSRPSACASAIASGSSRGSPDARRPCARSRPPPAPRCQLSARCGFCRMMSTPLGRRELHHVEMALHPRDDVDEVELLLCRASSRRRCRTFAAPNAFAASSALARVDIADRGDLDALGGEIAPAVQMVLREEPAADDADPHECLPLIAAVEPPLIRQNSNRRSPPGDCPLDVRKHLAERRRRRVQHFARPPSRSPRPSRPESAPGRPAPAPSRTISRSANIAIGIALEPGVEFARRPVGRGIGAGMAGVAVGLHLQQRRPFAACARAPPLLPSPRRPCRRPGRRR